MISTQIAKTSTGKPLNLGENAVLEAEKGASPVAETRNKDIEDQLAGTPGASGGLKARKPQKKCSVKRIIMVFLRDLT